MQDVSLSWNTLQALNQWPRFRVEGLLEVRWRTSVASSWDPHWH